MYESDHDIICYYTFIVFSKKLNQFVPIKFRPMDFGVRFYQLFYSAPKVDFGTKAGLISVAWLMSIL